MLIQEPFNYSPKNANRTLHIYLPNDYDFSQERYPVMYFFDGHNLFRDSDAHKNDKGGHRIFRCEVDAHKHIGA